MIQTIGNAFSSAFWMVVKGIANPVRTLMGKPQVK